VICLEKTEMVKIPAKAEWILLKFETFDDNILELNAFLRGILFIEQLP